MKGLAGAEPEEEKDDGATRGLASAAVPASYKPYFVILTTGDEIKTTNHVIITSN